jgi:CheY-like chemotaxis protein
VVPAADGDAGLQQLKAADFDLLVLDLVMPLTSGFEVLAELERRKIRIPTIVTSGIVIPGVHDYLKTHAQVRLLSKPFDRAALLGCVRDLLRGGPA